MSTSQLLKNLSSLYADRNYGSGILETKEDEVRLYIAQKLLSVIDSLKKRVFSETKEKGVKIITDNKQNIILLRDGATYEVEFEIDIDFVEKIEFGILIDSNLDMIIDLRNSNKILSIENFKNEKVESDDIVLKFVEDFYVLLAMTS